jgi:hypothetical protein
MNKHIRLLQIIVAFLAAPLSGADTPTEKEMYDSMTEPGAVMFTPPQGWRYADNDKLGRSVKIMVVGESASHFPPSINLATEPFQGTLKDYLKIMKKINDVEGTTWKDLGVIKTNAGNASLSQVDIKNQWGDVREMHVVLKRKNTIYIVTSAASKDEFSKYYKEFFESMKSLKINKDFDELVSSPSLREELLKKIAALKIAAQRDSFGSEEFQKNEWEPFKKFLNEKFSTLGKKWSNYVEERIQKELTH